MKCKKVGKVLIIVLLLFLGTLLTLSTVGTVAHAAGLVDDTVDTANLYSKYPLGNYQLDFYVDNSWGWLPWNWGDGIGKSVMYGLYAITNFIWTVSLYLSNATGYVVQEAYKLDFISDTASTIGKNIQTLAGVSTKGFSSEGFYVGFLLILILIVGIYVAYTGLLKRETSKAIHAVINFVVVFILSASFIAYAPSYIEKINGFSADISNAALSLGTKIVLPNSKSQGKDSVDLIRDSLFSVQVQQPWLLLQYDSSDMDSIGKDRVEELLSISPNTNNGEDREKKVKQEIEDKNNKNLTITKTMNRLGMVFFLFIFNLGISVFVFLLTGIMIFSQILFIIFAMFLPISFLLSMIPTYEGMAKRAITKLFNTIMMRAGITLIISVAFSISTMFYAISSGYPFFMIAFLQIVTFAGIYMKLGELMSMFSLQSNDSQQMGKRIFRRPYMMLNHGARRIEKRIERTMNGSGRNANKRKNSDRKEDDNHSQNTSLNNRKPESKSNSIKDTRKRNEDEKENANGKRQARSSTDSNANQVEKTSSNYRRGTVEEKQNRQQKREEKKEQFPKKSVNKSSQKKQTADSRVNADFAQEELAKERKQARLRNLSNKQHFDSESKRTRPNIKRDTPTNMNTNDNYHPANDLDNEIQKVNNKRQSSRKNQKYKVKNIQTKERGKQK